MIDIEDEKIILEIRGLVKSFEMMHDEVNIYCDLMKEIFLNGSKKN